MGYSEPIMADYIFKGCPREIGGTQGCFLDLDPTAAKQFLTEPGAGHRNSIRPFLFFSAQSFSLAFSGNS